MNDDKDQVLSSEATSNVSDVQVGSDAAQVLNSDGDASNSNQTVASSENGVSSVTPDMIAKVEEQAADLKKKYEEQREAERQAKIAKAQNELTDAVANLKSAVLDSTGGSFKLMIEPSRTYFDKGKEIKRADLSVFIYGDYADAFGEALSDSLGSKVVIGDGLAEE